METLKASVFNFFLYDELLVFCIESLGFEQKKKENYKKCKGLC